MGTIIAETVNEGVPTEDNVAEILDAIIPLFPLHILLF